MNNPPKIDHRKIVSYLRGVSTKKELARIQKIRQEDPVYDCFFDLINKLKEQVSISECTRTDKETPISFSVLEDILMRIMAGDILSTDAQQLIDGLVYSPIFYQRLLIQISPKGTACLTEISLRLINSSTAIKVTIITIFCFTRDINSTNEI